MITKAIEKNVELHFGIRPGQLSDTMVKALAGEIAQKFDSLSQLDIDFAYDRYQIEDNDNWKHPTKREILKPIILWWNQKELIKHEFEKHQQEEQKEALASEKEKQFLDLAIHLYKKSLQKGTWEGDMFHASVIAKKYLAPHIDQEIKNEVYKNAVREKKEAEYLAKEQAKKNGVGLLNISPQMLGASLLRVYSNLLVKKAIELKIQINR